MRIDYLGCMDQKPDDQTYPVINVDEWIGKTVGRRKPATLGAIQKTAREFFRSAQFRVCDPGVYRFSSHEEADEWMLKMAVKRALQAEKS